ncbi:hypothetical protein [Rhodococcoides fascians]|uniref:hypothetical protein n=1 Tax=Rhodococcoides fascians TaxID=1828 RepID=UPI000568839A|nr:hypothetical protein [Rhodococcus fascians]
MTITFDDARHYAELEWPRGEYAGFFPTMEPFVAGPDGAEDARSFLVGSAKPALDAEGMPAMDVPVIFVDKSSGIVTFEPIILNFDRMDKMTPVHSEEASTTT